MQPGPARRNVTRADYGATATTSLGLRPRDGLYVYRLDRQRIITCGTMHTTINYELAGSKLFQPLDRKAWGPLLKPGVYRSITIDAQSMTCLLDHGPAASPRLEVMGNYHGPVTVVGRQ